MALTSINGVTLASLSAINGQTKSGLSAINGQTIGGGGGTSYSNPLGSGNRTGLITVTNTGADVTGNPNDWIDGNTASGTSYWSSFGTDAAHYLRFALGGSYLIDEAKYYQELSTAQGTWQWQGSDDAAAWTNIGSSFALGGTATQTITALNGNVTYYNYYQIIGVSGTTSNTPYVYQWEFKISA